MTSGTRKPKGETPSAKPRASAASSKAQPKPTPRNGGGRRPVDSKTRARVVKLATTLDPAGKRRSRNAIAKLVGLSSSTVSRIVAEEVPGFDWTAKAAAVAASAAAQYDAKAERIWLSEHVLDEAKRILAKFTAPHVKVLSYQGSGYDHHLAGPESGDVKNYAIALGILIDKHAMLTKFDTDDRDLAAVDQWLEHLGEGVAA